MNILIEGKSNTPNGFFLSRNCEKRCRGLTTYHV